MGCGGADKWTVEPAATAFPLTKWASGSGTIFCDPGHFCPNATVQVTSPPGPSSLTLSGHKKLPSVIVCPCTTG